MKSSIISSYAGRLENIVSAEKLSRVASKIIVGIILPAAMKILTVFMAHHYVLRSINLKTQWVSILILRLHFFSIDVSKFKQSLKLSLEKSGLNLRLKG